MTKHWALTTKQRRWGREMFERDHHVASLGHVDHLGRGRNERTAATEQDAPFAACETFSDEFSSYVNGCPPIEPRSVVPLTNGISPRSTSRPSIAKSRSALAVPHVA